MNTKFFLKKTKYFPIVLFWLFSNVAPLAIFIIRYIDLQDLGAQLNEFILIIAIYIIGYGVNYFLGAITLDLTGADQYPGARRTILYSFSIVSTGIIIIILTASAYIFSVELKMLLLIGIGLECLLMIFMIVRRILISRISE